MLAYPPLPPGPPEQNWGQNRDIMKRGHATGFPQHFGTEDFAIFLSQGPIHDRSKEQLCSGDFAVVRVRHMLLKSVREFVAGQAPWLATNDQLDYAKIESVGKDLRSMMPWIEK